MYIITMIRIVAHACIIVAGGLYKQKCTHENIVFSMAYELSETARLGGRAKLEIVVESLYNCKVSLYTSLKVT